MKTASVMNTFKEVATKLLWDYKNVLKKYLPSQERNHKLNSLGLQGKTLVESDEVALYLKTLMVIADIESWISKNLDSASWYSGIEEFLNHSKRTLNLYQLEGHRVVHTAQTASRAMIHAIQLIAALPEQPQETALQPLTQHVDTIVRYGSEEQCQLLLNALQKHAEKHPHLFQTLMAQLQAQEEDPFELDESLQSC